MEDDTESDAPKKHTKHAHTEHEHKEYMEHKEHKSHKKHETIAWALGIVALVLVIALIVSIMTGGFSGTASSSGGVSEETLKAKTIEYLGQILPGQNVSVDSIVDEGNIYSLKLTVAGRPYDSYATKDGKLLFPSAIDMTASPETPAATDAQQPAATNIPKTDKPTVELFVMSHCPYGTQAEKGILPAVNALGNSIDFNIKFVYYAMHGEKEVKEELTQYCIRTEAPDKYLKYVACFLNDSAGQGSPEASNACIASLGIDAKKLDTCKTAADTKFDVMKNFNDQSTWLSGRFPLINFDKAENTQYSVAGSPTLVINGVESSAGRDSASYLAAICNAMTTPVAACNTQLSSVSPGPGFGYDSTAAATAAGCGV
jgi:hypothetical protein